MLPAHVRELWPMGGPMRGGTRVWLLTSRALANDPTVFFSILRDGQLAEQPLMIKAVNSTFISTNLVTAVTPALSSEQQHASMEARVWVGIKNGRVVQRLSALPGLNKFVYWSKEDMRRRGLDLTRRCILECNLFPPALFDEAADIQNLRPTGRIQIRAIPPGSKCESWRMLRPLTSLPRVRVEQPGLANPSAGTFMAVYFGDGVRHLP
ncbi:MAG: hypothetical protein SGPRY_008191 [Prymnesium sp.]